jgi:hypothetical protein
MEEDLNIYRATVRIIERCWYNKKRFPTIEAISTVTTCSTKTIWKIASDNGFPHRNKISKNATNKESAQARPKV